ncbi:GNAT family N-acetyltransferase [Neobacillus sedimentimangrovi]|uniref:GNAT family N-acetyltransferase n=1 Tax=Neobacillus sedimentimangrovi TaxID=2699460 RepID=A0ABS8QFW9_9BACI|nr:GNAT family N-acetyltransferase [Neobacillus sedimentimangrovi]
MLIFEGTLKKAGETTETPFEVRKLTMDDLPEILQVQDVVYQRLENKEVLQPLTKEEFQFILEGNGFMLGAFAEVGLIAFRAMLVPHIDAEHLGWDIGLSEEQLRQVIYQEISNVLPEYRGNRLQQLLAKLIMRELGKEAPSYRYVCCTVAPFNIPSLKDKFAQGMQIAALKEKYGGLLRYVFVKDLFEDEDLPWKEVEAIKMSNTRGQQEKLKQGWRGFKMEQRNNEIWVYYGRR